MALNQDKTPQTQEIQKLTLGIVYIEETTGVICQKLLGITNPCLFSSKKGEFEWV